MNKLFVAALMTCALCFSGTNCGAAKVQSPQTRELKTGNEPAAAMSTVTLTPEHPTNSFAVKANVLASDPEVLEVAITKVVNPSRTAVSIFVYRKLQSLSSRSARNILVESSPGGRQALRGESRQRR